MAFRKERGRRIEMLKPAADDAIRIVEIEKAA